MIDKLQFNKGLGGLEDNPFSRGSQTPRTTPEQYHGQLESAVSEGIISQEYADEIRGRFPEWGVEHIRQIKEREGKIKEMLSNPNYGLDEAVLFDLRQRDPSYCLRHLEYLKQREELIGQLLNNGLLDETQIAEIRGVSDPWYAVKKLNEIKNQTLIDTVRPMLRPEGLPIQDFSLPQEGESLTEHIISSLQQAGLYRKGLKIRVISKERVQHAFATGTDRDHTSLTTIHHGGDDGEELAMKENGLDASRDCDQVSYLSDFDQWSKDRKMTGDRNMAILVYAPEAVKPIQPSKNRTGSTSNGFHMFLDRRLIHPSLLAVFK